MNKNPIIPYVSLLKKTAQKSNHRQHHMAALIMRGGKIISVHENNGHIHAEHAAINRAWRSGVASSTIIILRVKASGELGMAKPCALCMERISASGIKKIIYTNVDGIPVTVAVQKKKQSKVVEYEFVKQSRIFKKKYG